MSEYKPTDRRNDAPPRANEIEIAPGGLAYAPRRVLYKNAVLPLRELHAQTKEFEKGVAEAQARLDRARTAAIAIQDEYESILSAGAGLTRLVGQAEFELVVSKKKMNELEGWIRQNWTHEPLHEQIGEYQRREFMATHLPVWISEWNAALVLANEKIDAFEKQNGLGKNPA